MLTASLAAAVSMALWVAAPAASGAPLGVPTPSKVDAYIGNYTGSNGSVVEVFCYEYQGYNSPNGTNGDYSRIRFSAGLTCSDVVRVRGTAELYTFGSGTASLMATGSSFDQNWTGISTGEATRSTLGMQQIKFHTSLDMPWGGVWTNVPFGCSGIHTGHVECHEFRFSTPFAFDPEAPVGLGGSLVNQAIGIAFGALGQAQEERACAQGQLSNPNPSNGSTACRAVGTGAAAANGGIGTINTAVAQAQADAACVQTQVTSPDPARGSQVCRTAGTAVKAANDNAATVVGAVNTAVAQAQADVACVQTQVTSPDPARGSQICRTAGTAVKATEDGEAIVLGVVSDAEEIADGAIASAEQMIGQAEQDAGCAQSQITDPDPERGSDACKAVGSGVSTARNVVSDEPGDWSDTCAPSATVIDGFAGSTYVRLRVQEVDDQRTWVCFRASQPNAADVGGRVEIAGTTGSPELPSHDEQPATCQPRAGNVGVVNGRFLGNEVHVNAVPSTDESWVCVEVGTFKKRVIIPIAGVTTPQLTTHLDQPTPPRPAPESGPAGYPSSRCKDFGGASATQVANMEGPSGSHAWLYTWQVTASKTAVCVRVEGAASAGGRLEVDTSPSPGVSPHVQSSSTDMTPCSEEVFDFTDPVRTFLKMSPAGTNPASVCVGLAGQQHRVTIGTTGSPSVSPVVTWTQDPST